MSSLTGRVRNSGIVVRDKGVNFLDTYVPPSQRQQYSDNVRSWAAVNPKLAAFVAAQLLLSGPPVLLFLGFSFTILTTSLLVCLLTALTVAFAFAAFCAGVALVVLIPTLLLTTTAATFLFVTGLIGSAAVSKFNNDPRTAGIRSRAKANAAAVGDTVKDASNGSIDLNSAAQHFTNKVSESMPQAVEDGSSDELARQHVARQALGIPEKLESTANGGSFQHPAHVGTAVSSDAYRKPVASTSGNYTTYTTPQEYQDRYRNTQAVS